MSNASQEGRPLSCINKEAALKYQSRIQYEINNPAWKNGNIKEIQL